MDSILPPVLCCSSTCRHVDHLQAINKYYKDIVDALHSAAVSSVVRVKCESMIPYQNDELDRLKADAIFWHNLWRNAGRPASGVVQRVKTSCKFQYMLAIRDAYVIMTCLRTAMMIRSMKIF